MASTYKRIGTNDYVATKDLLHEAIPFTGSIISGTYNEENIKDYSHGMFQTTYDYPYLSSSANEIFDITCGYSNNSLFSSSANNQNSKKINIYTQMAQVLAGHDTTGSILDFDLDGNIAAGGAKIREAFFVCFKRLLMKDEVKKDSFRMEVYKQAPAVGGNGPGFQGDAAEKVTLGDYGASTTYRANSPAGEYGIIYTSSATPNINSGVGLQYYQAGVAVLSSSIFLASSSATIDWRPQNNFWNRAS